MDKKNVIIVTGCSGRIGTKVIHQFSKDYTLIGFDIFDPRIHLPNFEWMNVDLSSARSVQEALNNVKQKYGNQLASVIHLAAYYNFTGEPSDKYETITVKGTERMLLGVKKEFQVEQFLFSSTLLVHAPCEPNEHITEDWPLSGTWDYPQSKIETEAVMRKHHGSIPIVMLRIAGCYDDACHSIPISNQIQRLYERQFASRVFPGDLTHGASYLHMDDLVDCLWLAVQKRAELPSECVLLIGEPYTMSYDEIQRTISRLLYGKEITTLRIPKWFAKLGAWLQNHTPFMPKTFIKPWMVDVADDNYTIDISLAKQLLGWVPKHDLRNVFPTMIADFKANPLAWYREQKLDCPKWLQKKLTKKP